MDYIRYGDGLTVYGTPEFSIEEVYQDDLSNGYGIVDKIGGVYYLKGSIIIGDSSGTNATIYNDENKVLVFADEIVSNTLYKIQVVGNATGDTAVTFKDCVITSANPLFDLDFDDAAVESVTITGCQISSADEILLDVNCTVETSVFNGCGLITPEAATVEDTTISNPSGSIALTYPDLVADDNMARLTFIEGTYAIEITTDVDHTFDGHKFSGTWTAHVHNSSGASIIVYATNGSDASTYTGTTDIQNSVTVTLTGVVEGSEISVQRAGTLTVESYVASSAANGEFAYTFNSPPSGFTNVDIFIVKQGYEWYPIYNYPLPTTSASLPVSQEADRNYIS